MLSSNGLIGADLIQPRFSRVDHYNSHIFIYSFIPFVRSFIQFIYLLTVPKVSYVASNQFNRMNDKQNICVSIRISMDLDSCIASLKNLQIEPLWHSVPLFIQM